MYITRSILFIVYARSLCLHLFKQVSCECKPSASRDISAITCTVANGTLTCTCNQGQVLSQLQTIPRTLTTLHSSSCSHGYQKPYSGLQSTLEVGYNFCFEELGSLFIPTLVHGVITPNIRTWVPVTNLKGYTMWRPIPVAARSKAWVYGRSLAGIVGSNPSGGMDVCLFWVLCVVR